MAKHTGIELRSAGGQNDGLSVGSRRVNNGNLNSSGHVLSTLMESHRVSKPFVVHQLARPSVAWINRRWFASQGMELSKPVVRARIEAELLGDFAWVVPRREDPPSAFTGTLRTWHADRYGEEGRVDHGGSGRAGHWKDFQVKGVGVTPLVGRNADWLHAHGCMWMEEAAREAIYAEIFERFLPYGAVPVIAIIDTHLHAEMPPGQVGERRALLIRPMVVRAAHFLRATHYQAWQSPWASHAEDVERIDAVFEWLERVAGSAKDGALALESLSMRVADQLAYMDGHRLSLGGLSASSFALDGRAIDFGGARSTRDWRSAEMMRGRARFGHEWQVWLRILNALAFQSAKRGMALNPSCGAQFSQRYWHQLSERLAEPWLACLGNTRDGIANDVRLACKAWYTSEQRQHTSYAAEDPRARVPFYELMENPAVSESADHRDVMLAKLMQCVRQSLDSGEHARSRLSWLSQCFKAKDLLDREALQAALFRDVVPAHPIHHLAEGALEQVIDACVTSVMPSSMP